MVLPGLYGLHEFGHIRLRGYSDNGGFILSFGHNSSPDATFLQYFLDLPYEDFAPDFEFYNSIVEIASFAVALVALGVSPKDAAICIEYSSYTGYGPVAIFQNLVRNMNSICL